MGNIPTIVFLISSYYGFIHKNLNRKLCFFLDFFLRQLKNCMLSKRGLFAAIYDPILTNMFKKGNFFLKRFFFYQQTKSGQKKYPSKTYLLVEVRS